MRTTVLALLFLCLPLAAETADAMQTRLDLMINQHKALVTQIDTDESWVIAEIMATGVTRQVKAKQAQLTKDRQAATNLQVQIEILQKKLAKTRAKERDQGGDFMGDPSPNVEHQPGPIDQMLAEIEALQDQRQAIQQQIDDTRKRLRTAQHAEAKRFIEQITDEQITYTPPEGLPASAVRALEGSVASVNRHLRRLDDAKARTPLDAYVWLQAARNGWDVLQTAKDLPEFPAHLFDKGGVR